MPRETVSSSRHDDGTSQHGGGLYVAHHGPRADPPIVLVHGAPDRSAAFRPVLGHLGGYDVTVYDRRGYGRSLRATPARAMVDHANDLLAIAETCTSPSVVVAHSFGSNPTMLAATLRPEAFAALGLWEPPLPWVAWWPERTKNYNANVASFDAPADDIEEMYRRLLGGDAWCACRSTCETSAAPRDRPFKRTWPQSSMPRSISTTLSFLPWLAMDRTHRPNMPTAPPGSPRRCRRPDSCNLGHGPLRSSYPPRGFRRLCALRPVRPKTKQGRIGPRASMNVVRVWSPMDLIR